MLTKDDTKTMRREGRLVIAEAHVMVIETAEIHGYLPNTGVAVYPVEAVLAVGEQKPVEEMSDQEVEDTLMEYVGDGKLKVYRHPPGRYVARETRTGKLVYGDTPRKARRILLTMIMTGGAPGDIIWLEKRTGR